MRRLIVVGLSLALLAGASVGAAADYSIGGTQVTLKRSANGKGSVSLVLRDPAIPVAPLDSSDDPSLAGMVLTVFGRVSGERASYVAVAGRGPKAWKARATSRTVTYSFTNTKAAAGDLRSAKLRTKSGLTLRATSAGLTLAAPEGAVAVRVAWGSVRVCALFDGASVRSSKVGLFSARKAAASLANCDDETLAGTAPPSCGGIAPSCDGACPAGEACGSVGATDPTCQCLPIDG